MNPQYLIFTREGCPPCARIKEYCKRNNITFMTLSYQKYEAGILSETNGYKYTPTCFKISRKPDGNLHFDFIGGTEEFVDHIGIPM